MIHAIASRARRPRPRSRPRLDACETGVVSVRSGLPKQTVEQWEHTLSEAIATGAVHISVYDLQVTSLACNGFSHPVLRCSWHVVMAGLLLTFSGGSIVAGGSSLDRILPAR